MPESLLIGLPEIASFLRCSVRKLHDPKIKKDMEAKRVIFRRRMKPYGAECWAAYTMDLIAYMKEKSAKGEPP